MKKIVLIGAGSAVFGLGTINDIFQSDSLVGSTIVLHDINEAALKKITEAAEKFREKNNLNVLNPDSKIAYIFDDLTNYNASKMKYSRTVDEAITNFNEGYLAKTLNTTEFLTLVILANDLNKIFVGTE